MPIRARVFVTLALCAALGACATRSPSSMPVAKIPAQWQAPLPHQGAMADLQQWWRQFDDPLVAELIADAEAASSTVAQAASRIEQSRAARTAAGAALQPKLDSSASILRGVDLVNPLGTTVSVGLQASWELDLFGGNRAARDAAAARLEGAEADWHAARVSIAAETASNYLALRACEAQQAQTRADAGSRAETARLTDLSLKAGFQSPANAALARASAAQGNALLTVQRAQCDAAVKALVAMTARDEPALRTQLAARTTQLPMPAQISVPAVPGEALSQRPDLRSAARELLASSADISQAQAQRWPRISVAGSISAGRFEGGGVSGSGTLWQLGPLTVSLPIFDGGTRAANVVAARARYDAAAIVYRSSVLQAVREVEEALLQLQSTSDRAADTRTAVEGFDASLRANEALYKSGLASLFQLEDARRSAVQAQAALIDLQRERVAAWIALYRALGGGWTPATEAARADRGG